LTDEDYPIDDDLLADLSFYLQERGIDIPVTTAIKVREENEAVPVVDISSMPKVVKEVKSKPVYQRKDERYTTLYIRDLKDEVANVSFVGEVFRVNNITTKNNRLIQTLYIKDIDSAVIAKRYENQRNTREELEGVKTKTTYCFYGSFRYDEYQKSYVFFIDKMNKDKPLIEMIDDEEEKRVELHAHSNRSEMDGVCDVADIVQAAFDMGHRGLAITDHAVIQAFPIAQKKVKDLLKSHKDREFKMLYGVEFNLVEENLNIVYNSKNEVLRNQEYVVYDLETTGLSKNYDSIIEFGAVVVAGGEIIDRRQFFIKPPIEIPVNIQNLTNIRQSDVENAKTFAEMADEICDLFKGRILVAHNASFDFGFINEELRRINRPLLDDTVIDTLDFAKALFKHRRSYRLGNMARLYKIEFNEDVAHRADYDAEVLQKVFNKLLKDAAELGITTADELRDYKSEGAFARNFSHHATAICLNKDGLKDLFKLVSISHTDELAIFGKANAKASGSEYLAEPRIFRTTLDKYRKDILIGSACLNGEVFDTAAYGSQSELEKAISYYDYIEVQPLENYRTLIESGSIRDLDTLKDIVKRIIYTAIDQDKIVVATGDLHYISPDQKVLRDVYISAQGIGGVRHPLYIYDTNRRLNTENPSQGFLNTRQMKEAFAYLNDEKLIEQIVVDNTNKILDMCDTLYPIHDKLYTPKIENSEQLLTDLVYDKAHELYGDDLDPMIEDRIKRELDAVISHGYAVIYYVSHLLVKKSNEDGYLVGSRGSVGSSLIATLSGITEVNPLKPHYRCPKCKHFEWVDDAVSGYNLSDKVCPECGSMMIGDGQDIPFETFLGFNGDKVPDIDLNFSSEYQDKAHLFTREVFGEDHVFRAGTISTVASKTAFGYVKGYMEEYHINTLSDAMIERLVEGCTDVKRTTGQHPGGIIVIPSDYDVYDFTPIQYPANDPDAVWRTTHFDFHEIHDNVLKFDILGHVDPTAMRLLQNISGINPRDIPMNDAKVLSIFNSTDALNIINPNYTEKTGALGLPEFGTRFVRGILELTRPQNFSDLVQISGLSHGTDVWSGNARNLIENGITLPEVIGCRDDIMTTMISYGLPNKDSFTIMEGVRKGRGLTPEQEKLMLEHNVPKWYIESCKLIKYMFPKAHAVAYVIMAIRVAYFKVYYPIYYYISVFSLRVDAY
ncbi:MAG: PolC-type DNA polymerase III, partial [Erysipelotrichaceae bacterium]|nr:PolC-type DNA polymerase III [Erysipelotrichaceae bacterium]